MNVRGWARLCERSSVTLRTPTTLEIAAMKRLCVLSALVMLTLGGCKIRHPFGGCPYNEVELLPQFMTPWGTVLEQDITALAGPYLGTLTWLDGDDVITVAKAGQAFEVEAMIDIDLSTARMHEYTREPRQEGPCEPNRLYVDATAILAELYWKGSDRRLHAEFLYAGQSQDSPTTAYGNRKPVAEFVVPESSVRTARPRDARRSPSWPRWAQRRGSRLPNRRGTSGPATVAVRNPSSRAAGPFGKT